MTSHIQIATGLAKIGTFLRSQQWRQAEASALTPTQAQILIHLVARGPERVTVVADEIAVTQPTASDAVGALVRKGHVTKKPDPEDARAIRLHPTAKGRGAAKELAVWPDALLEAVDTLDIVEQAAFVRGLTKMIQALQVRGAVPVQHMCATCQHFRPYAHSDADKPHHCDFVDAAFGDASLRLDCSDYTEAAQHEGSTNWIHFLSSGSRPARHKE